MTHRLTYSIEAERAFWVPADSYEQVDELVKARMARCEKGDRPLSSLEFDIRPHDLRPVFRAPPYELEFSAIAFMRLKKAIGLSQDFIKQRLSGDNVGRTLHVYAS